MGMSTHVVAIRPADATWQRMKAAWDACVKAGVPIPEAVFEFFDGETPDTSGVVIDIEYTPAVRKWQSDMKAGFEVLLDELPDGVKIVRFYNSY